MTPDLNTLMTRYTQDLVNRQQAANQPQQDQPKKRGLITGLLPTIGSIAGSFTPLGPVVGSGVGSGGGELLAELINHEKISPTKIGGEAVTGGIAGKIGTVFGLGREANAAIKTAGEIGAKAAPKVAGEAASKAATDVTAQVAKQAPETLNRGIGTTIRQASLKPGFEGSVLAPAKKEVLGPLQIKYHLNGSPQAVAEKAVGKITALDSAGHALLDKADPVAGKQLFRQAIQDFRQGLQPLGHYAKEPAYKAALKAAEKRIGEAANSGQLNSVYDLKTALADETRKFMEQIGGGGNFNLLDTPTSINLQVKKVAYDSLKKTLDKFAPEITNINADQAGLYDLALAGARGAKQGLTNFNPLGIPIGTAFGRPLQAGADLVGRGIQNVENLPGVQLAGRTVLPAATGQAIARGAGGISSLASGLGQPQQDQSQAPTSDLMSQLSAPTQKTDQSPVSQFSAQDAAAAIAANDPKYSSQIMAIYNLLNPKAGATQQSDVFIQKANDNIDSLLQSGSSLGEGPLAGGLASASIQSFGGTGVSQDTVGLNQRYQLLKLNILRAYQGARISDADFKLANLYTPSISDTPQTAQTKLVVLKDILNNSTPPTQTGNPGTTTADTSSLLNQFSQ